MARPWAWVLPLIGVGLRFVPTWVWLAALNIGTGLIAGTVGWFQALPGHAIVLLVAGAMAGVTATAQGAFALYWRIRLLRLLRAADRLIPQGRAREAALLATQGTAMWPTEVAHAETWRTEMHQAVLSDPRIGPYRDQLTDQGGNRISIPLAALEALRDDLRQRF